MRVEHMGIHGLYCTHCGLTAVSGSLVPDLNHIPITIFDFHTHTNNIII